MLHKLEAVVNIAILFLAVWIGWRMIHPPEPTASSGAGAITERKEGPPPSIPIPLTGYAKRGNADAAVALLEYSDFQCPYCRAFALNTLPALQQKYIATGKVLFAFAEFPLENVHSSALSAASAAECAGEQGKFWEMHDLLFKTQTELADFEAHAAVLHLHASAFSKCIASMPTAIRIAEVAARRVAVSGTPTFFIGKIQRDGTLKVTKRLTGSLPIGSFIRALDPLLGGT